MENIKCPKCGSEQITANKKGFSGKKAVVGGLLTGGIGLLAGTIGSNKVKITCLACGNVFNPGEQKVTYPVRPHSNLTIKSDPEKDAQIIETAKLKGKLEAVNVCKSLYVTELKTSMDHVNEITKGLDIPKPVVQKPILAKVMLLIFMIICSFTVLIAATLEGWTTFTIFLILDIFFFVMYRNVIRGYKENKGVY